ncbi:MAG: tryptophan--tRNA ligase [Candidatus Paceibacterota bacterium]
MQSPKPRLVSGVKPTGRIHVGNYFGAIRQFIAMQDEYDAFIFLPNLHALTENVLTKDELIMHTNNAVLDYLGAGLDPDKVTFFKQSDILAHTNLAWIFNSLVSVPYLMRAHAYKDAEAKGKETTAGTFMYPVLMAADILLYDATIVPVGNDQKQHVEYARDIAGKFNHQYGEHFVIPKALIQEETGIVPGVDGRKMSKSYGNTIPLFGTDTEITKAVMSIVTDSRERNEVKDPNELVLYQIHKLFNSSTELREQYAQGLGYGDAKKLLAKEIIDFVTPMRERRAAFAADPKLVQEILIAGAHKANDVAMKKIFDVYEAIGLTE